MFPLFTGLNHPLFDQLNPFKWHSVQTNPIGFYGESGIAELFEAGTTTDEHVVEPRGEGDRDETAHGCGIDGFGVGPLPRLFVTGTRNRLACMPVDWGKSWEPAHVP